MLLHKKKVFQRYNASDPSPIECKDRRAHGWWKNIHDERLSVEAVKTACDRKLVL
jgi:hypothetical protein